MILGTIAIGVLYLSICAYGAFYFDSRAILSLVLLSTGCAYLCQLAGVVHDQVIDRKRQRLVAFVSSTLWGASVVFAAGAGLALVLR